jgi:hypothetical protein
MAELMHTYIKMEGGGNSLERCYVETKSYSKRRLNDQVAGLTELGKI